MSVGELHWHFESFAPMVIIGYFLEGAQHECFQRGSMLIHYRLYDGIIEGSDNRNLDKVRKLINKVEDVLGAYPEMKNSDFVWYRRLRQPSTWEDETETAGFIEESS